MGRATRSAESTTVIRPLYARASCIVFTAQLLVLCGLLGCPVVLNMVTACNNSRVVCVALLVLRLDKASWLLNPVLVSLVSNTRYFHGLQALVLAQLIIILLISGILPHTYAIIADKLSCAS